METAILAMMVIGFGAAGWYLRKRFYDLDCRIESARQENMRTHHQMADNTVALLEIHALAEETRDVLREASRIKSLRNYEEPAAEKDAGRQPLRPRKYIGIAERRSAAERASAEPANHAAQVAANNAKAMGA